LSFLPRSPPARRLPSFPTRRSSDLQAAGVVRHPAQPLFEGGVRGVPGGDLGGDPLAAPLLGGLVAGGSVSLWAVRRGRCPLPPRSEEHTSELQSRENLVCRLLLEKK